MRTAIERKGIGFEQEENSSRENIMLQSVDGSMSGEPCPSGSNQRIDMSLLLKQIFEEGNRARKWLL